MTNEQPLPRPLTSAGSAALAALLAEPAAALVALDLDGTLAPIAARPEAVVPHPDAVAALLALTPLVGRLAILTGRPAAEAVSVGRLAGVPGLVVAGHYGLERWADGRLDSPAPHPGVASVRLRLGEVVATAPAGTTLEDKGHSLAVHTRGAADPAGTLQALRPVVEAIAAGAGLEVEPGRLVLELRPPGTDKGAALTELVTETGDAARASGGAGPVRSILYAGDDVGDLPVVDAVTGLREQGVLGAVVCADSAESPAELRARADFVVDGPGGVVSLLQALVRALTSAPG